MKCFFFLLSCFTLYLSCIPCSDGEECNEKLEASIAADTNHQQHSHDSENCSPFCTCSCCAAPVFFMPFANVQTNKAAFLPAKYSIYNLPFNAEVHYSIWQPPQIA